MEIEGVTQSVPSQFMSDKERTELGRDDFLQLLVAQLANQDPLEPMENSEFVAQLAQFSSLEQLMSMGKGMDMLSTLQQASQSTQVVSFIGKELTAAGNRLELSSFDGAPIHFRLSGPARQVSIQLTDGMGTVVASGEVSGHWGSGTNRIEWADVTWHQGGVPPGSYSVSIQAQGDVGEVGVDPLTVGRVTGISYERGYPVLLIGEQEVALNEIISVEEG